MIAIKKLQRGDRFEYQGKIYIVLRSYDFSKVAQKEICNEYPLAMQKEICNEYPLAMQKEICDEYPLQVNCKIDQHYCSSEKFTSRKDLNAKVELLPPSVKSLKIKNK